MPSLISMIMRGTKQADDQTIATEMMMGAKAACNSYLVACLEASTPELRALYSTHLNQILGGHAALTNLAINKNWYKAYEAPDQQLIDVVKQSQTVIMPQA